MLSDTLSEDVSNVTSTQMDQWAGLSGI